LINLSPSAIAHVKYFSRAVMFKCFFIFIFDNIDRRENLFSENFNILKVLRKTHVSCVYFWKET
jgi:hypothetical protein